MSYTLTVKTDNPLAEIGLYRDGELIDYVKWQAHRELSITIHHKIQAILQGSGIQLADLGGIVCFRGPGSFTGLRIGLSVANALADGLEIPIVGTMGDDWIRFGVDRLKMGDDDRMVVPEYGAEPHITKQKK